LENISKYLNLLKMFVQNCLNILEFIIATQVKSGGKVIFGIIVYRETISSNSDKCLLIEVITISLATAKMQAC